MAEENETADRALADDLARSGKWHQRITGYSPTTRLAEACWAAELNLPEACDLGLRYLQDAICYVSGDELCFSLCAEPMEQDCVGNIRERIKDQPPFPRPLILP